MDPLLPHPMSDLVPIRSCNTKMFHSLSRAANGTAALPMDTLMTCMNHFRVKSAGIFHGDNPLHFPNSILLVQLATSSLITASLYFLFAPISLTVFVCQMLGGFLLGPQALGKHFTFLQSIYHIKSLYVLNTVSLFACALFLFLIGIKTDIRLLTASGKKAIVIGISTFFVPLILNLSVAFTLMACVKLEPQVYKSLHFVATLESFSSFYLIACQLEDLKMLTSELGRLALSSSLVSGTVSWGWATITFSTTESFVSRTKGILFGTILSTAAFITIVVYLCRPFVAWLVERVHQARGVKESHLFLVYMMVLGLSLLGDCMSLNFLFGPMIVGIIIPSRPPLGSAVVEKLDTTVNILVLPFFYSLGTTIVNLSSISAINFGVIELLVLVGFFGKTLGAMVPCILNRMPVYDALSLGLIMGTQGITDVLMFLHAQELNFVDKESYSLALISSVVMSIIATPVVKWLYKPPDRYVSYKRRTIQHSKPEAELRMVACIYNHDSTPSIINLLELSNPQMQSSIAVYLLHLVKQTGTAATLLYAHPRRAASSSPFDAYHYSDNIVNAFRKYENLKGGNVVVNLFTAVSPYVTMHEDACSLALSKRASIMIVPFHQQLAMANELGSVSSVRSVNLNILKSAPCSVAILVDRGTRCGSYPGMNSEASVKYKIGVFFLGGQDDREAVSYAMRMGEKTDISVTVIHFQDGDGNTSKTSLERKEDISLTNEFRLYCKVRQKNTYREEFSSNSEELVAKIRAVENNFHMILVGRRHSADLPLLAGLDEWNEHPELGSIGDMLAAKDSSCKASVLVIQQQTFIGDEEILDSPKHQESDRDSSAVIDMPRDNAKVWPGFNDDHTQVSDDPVSHS